MRRLIPNTGSSLHAVEQSRMKDLRHAIDEGDAAIIAGEVTSYSSGKQLADDIIRRGQKRLQLNTAP